MKVKVAQLCPTLYDPVDCTPTGVGGLSLLQGIVPTQGLNPGLPHCRQMGSLHCREAQKLGIAVEFRLVSAHILLNMCISTETTKVYLQVCGWL